MTPPAESNIVGHQTDDHKKMPNKLQTGMSDWNVRFSNDLTKLQREERNALLKEARKIEAEESGGTSLMQ